MNLKSEVREWVNDFTNAAPAPITADFEQLCHPDLEAALTPPCTCPDFCHGCQERIVANLVLDEEDIAELLGEEERERL